MRLSHLAQLDFLEDQLAEPAWWPGVLMRVVDGETLNEIAKNYGCNGSVLREWMKREDDREVAYQEAIERKAEMRREELQDRTARAAFATVQDAQSSSGEWLEVQMWPSGVLAAADDVEFGPDGRPYKIKMNSGKAGDRLARMLGMDRTGQTQVNLSMSLVGVLSEMPPAARREIRKHDVSDADVVPAKVLTEADAPESAVAVTPAARSSLAVGTPGRSVVGAI